MKRRSFLRTLMGSSALIVVAPASALAEIHRWVPAPLRMRFRNGSLVEFGIPLRRTGATYPAWQAGYGGAAGGGKSHAFDLNEIQRAIKACYGQPLQDSLMVDSALLDLFEEAHGPTT
jgi:hypothetical protein